MNSEGRFVLHPDAAQDIIEIWEYIAEDNPYAASRVREEILDSIRSLTSFPDKGFKRSDLTSRPLRFQIVKDYLIVYAPDEDPLLIVAVVHTRRSPRIIAAILRNRL